MSNLNEIFADVKKEGEDAFPSDEETKTPETPTTEGPKGGEEKKPETPADSQPAKTEEANAKEDTPYHLRWKKREEKLRSDLQEQFQHEMAQMKADYESKLPKSDVPVPEWFKELYGENVTAWQKYLEHEEAKAQEIEERIFARSQEIASQQEAETAYWSKWVDDQVDRLKDEGKSFEKTELLKVMLDYRPTDEKGNFDFDAGFKLYSALKAGRPTAEANPKSPRKALADTVTKTGKGETPKKDFISAQDLRRKSWDALAHGE